MPPMDKGSIPPRPDAVSNLGDYLSRQEALAVLGVKPQTLYAYVSRGFLRSVPQPGGRGSYYLREDVETLRAKSVARSGHGPAAASAMRWGEPIIGTGITEITGQGPRYRNHLALDLAKRRYSFETVAELLWGGVLAEEPVLWRAAPLPSNFAALLCESASLHERPHLLQLLAVATVGLGIAEGSRRERILSGSTPVLTARQLIRALAGVFGFVGKHGGYVPLEDGESIAHGLFRGLGIPAAKDQTAALDAALVLVADHELNPATFSARIAASCGADMHSCVAAALNTHYGSRIGRACDRVEQLFGRPTSPAEVVARAKELLASARKLPGFDHHLYPEGDPRARALIEIAQSAGSANIGVRHMVQALTRIEQEFDARPSVECGMVFLARALGVPDQSAGGLYALGRCAGWMAHVMEQRLAGFMIRPRAKFGGARDAERT